MSLSKKVSFAPNAFRRVDRALSMSHDEVAELLSSDKYRGIGISRTDRGVRDLKLFWSRIDQDFFVAIQARDLTVVAILHVSQIYDRHVSLGAKNEARQKVDQGLPDESKIDHTDLKFTFHIIDSHGGESELEYTLPLSEYRQQAHHLKSLRNDRAVRTKLVDFARGQLDGGEFVEKVTAHNPRSGETITLDITI